LVKKLKPDNALSESDRIRLMKVVVNYSGGGTEGQVHNLVKHMDRQQFDVRFSCMKKWGHFLDEMEHWNLPITEFPVSNFYSPDTTRQFIRLVAAMRRQNIQICHSYNFYANVFAIPAARLAGVPVIIASIRDQGVYLTPAKKRVQKLICSMADCILVNSDSIRDWLQEEQYPAKKISVIKNGIDLQRYAKETDSGALRAELGIPEDAPIVTMLSRLNPQKGIDDFLRAAAHVSSTHPDAWYLVVGEKLEFKDKLVVQDKNYHEYLHQLTLQHGIAKRVIFAGHRNDVPDLLNISAISVLPSHSEGLSNTLLESMAAGVPMVATSVGGNAELVRHGINGMLVPVHSPMAIAAAIINILDQPELAARFGRASKRLAAEQFSMSGMVSKTEEFYSAQLEKRECLKGLRKAI